MHSPLNSMSYIFDPSVLRAWPSPRAGTRPARSVRRGR